MKTYQIKIELKSDALIGSGEGFGTIINSDVVFDDLGLPMIPAKRLKGCLRDAANEVCHMLQQAKIEIFKDSSLSQSEKNEYEKVANIFGRPGQKESTPIYFSNCTIEEYENKRNALCYFKEKYPTLLTADKILSTFAYLRRQTAIGEESGAAQEHSLRTIRVLKKGLVFYGEISLEQEDQGDVNLLALACFNLRRLGGKRQRGFGEVECKILPESIGKDILLQLEALCKN